MATDKKRSINEYRQVKDSVYKTPTSHELEAKQKRALVTMKLEEILHEFYSDVESGKSRVISIPNTIKKIKGIYEIKHTLL